MFVSIAFDNGTETCFNCEQNNVYGCDERALNLYYFASHFAHKWKHNLIIYAVSTDDECGWERWDSCAAQCNRIEMHRTCSRNSINEISIRIMWMATTANVYNVHPSNATRYELHINYYVSAARRTEYEMVRLPLPHLTWDGIECRPVASKWQYSICAIFVSRLDAIIAHELLTRAVYGAIWLSKHNICTTIRSKRHGDVVWLGCTQVRVTTHEYIDLERLATNKLLPFAKCSNRRKWNSSNKLELLFIQAEMLTAITTDCTF